MFVRRIPLRRPVLERCDCLACRNSGVCSGNNILAEGIQEDRLTQIFIILGATDLAISKVAPFFYVHLLSFPCKRRILIIVRCLSFCYGKKNIFCKDVSADYMVRYGKFFFNRRGNE